MEQFKGFQIQSIIGNDNGKVSEWEQKIKEREAEVKYNAYINSGVPERYFNESIESFICDNEKMQEIKNKVQKFAENPKNKILVLYGENGNGKRIWGQEL
jgi:transcriptional regulator with PAS, ATPase and Fis domain